MLSAHRPPSFPRRPLASIGTLDLFFPLDVWRPYGILPTSVTAFSPGARVALVALSAAALLASACRQRSDGSSTAEAYSAAHGRLLDLASSSGAWRLSGQPAPSGDERAPDSAAWLAVAAAIESDLAREPSAEHYAAAGVSRLLAGRPAAAAELLAEARSLAGADPRIRNDYAVARQAVAAADDAGNPLAALSVLDELLQSAPPTGAPWLMQNRALALSELNLSLAARQALEESVERESDPRWRELIERRRVELPSSSGRGWDEARRRLEAAALGGDLGAVAEIVGRWTLASRDAVEEEILGTWADAILAGDRAEAADRLVVARRIAEALAELGDFVARDALDRLTEEQAPAYRDYRDARLAQGAGAFERGLALASSAAERLARSGSPFASLARRVAATCRYQQGDLARALDETRDALATPVVQDYPSLSGRWLWLHGISLVGLGRPAEGLRAYDAAAEAFGALQDAEAVVLSQTFAAETLNYLGQTSEAARRLESAWSLAATLRGRHRVGLVASELATLCLREGLLEAALVFQDEAVRIDAESGPEYAEGYSRMERARIHLEAGRPRDAERDLAEARRILGRLPAGALHERMAADLDLAEGNASLLSDPSHAAAVLRRSLGYFDRVGRTFQPLTARYLLARAVLAEGDVDGAMASLRQGLWSREHLRAVLPTESQRESFFDAAQGFFDDLVEVTFLRGDVAGFFDAAERSRSRVLLDRTALDATRPWMIPEPVPLDEVRKRLPPHVALLEYHVTDRQVYVACISAAGATLHVLGTRHELETELEALGRREHLDTDPRLRLGSLYDRLVKPCEAVIGGAETLVVVPHRMLTRLPFAALHDDRRGYVLETYTLYVAPSAAVAIAASEESSRSGSPPEEVLIYADPMLAELPGGLQLPRLPGARREAMAVAREYARAEVRAGTDAQRDRFLAEAGGFAVVHLATHGVNNSRHPLRSFLALAPTAASDDGLLTAAEIAALHLPRTRLVVLSACDTARGRAEGSEGSMSTARAFLTAGVPAVIASLQAVDDQTSALLFSQFHRRFANGEPAARALREAQLELLRGEDPSLRSPVEWGSFQLIGGVPLAPGGNAQ